MANANPPLFVQDGVYPAHLDRTLTGGLLVPSGVGAVPRPGVRPQSTDGSGETSLRVQASGATISVAAGSAFVGGTSAQGISGAYFISSPSPQSVALPSVIPGTPQEALVGITVRDPEIAGTSSGEGEWDFFVVQGTAPPGHFLTLARVSIPGTEGGNVAVTDLRTYTAALGGVIIARGGLSDLNLSAEAMPYGSQAYSITDQVMYTRGVNGWAQNPANAKVITGSVTGVGNVGELLWARDTDTLYVYDTDKNGVPGWIRVASAPAVARTAYATGWSEGPNDAQISPSSLNITVQPGGWYSIGNSQIALMDPQPGETKPDEKQFILQVKSTSDKTFISIDLVATVHVKKIKPPDPPEGGKALDIVTDDGNSLSIAVEIIRATEPALRAGAVANDDAAGFYIMKSLDNVTSGSVWVGNGGQRAHNIDYTDLGVGTFQIRPVFQSAQYGYFEITDLFMKVTTK